LRLWVIWLRAREYRSRASFLCRLLCAIFLTCCHMESQSLEKLYDVRGTDPGELLRIIMMLFCKSYGTLGTSKDQVIVLTQAEYEDSVGTAIVM
jgi:hypothetical protein